jgi:hypothetical protein
MPHPDLLKQIQLTLEAMAADAAKYPQLKLPQMQQDRLDRVLNALWRDGKGRD